MGPVATIVAKLVVAGARFRVDPEDRRLVIEARTSIAESLRSQLEAHRPEIVAYATHTHRMSPDGRPWCHFTSGFHCRNDPCLNPNHRTRTP